MSEYTTRNGYTVSGPDDVGEIDVEDPRGCWVCDDPVGLAFTRADLEAMLAMFGGDGERVCEKCCTLLGDDTCACCAIEAIPMNDAEADASDGQGRLFE